MVNRIDHQPTSIEFTLPSENKVKSVERKEQRHTNSNQNMNEQQTSDETLSKKEASEMVESMNHILNTADSKLKFVLHDKLEKYYVTVIDSETDEVIKEIPSKKLMDIHAAFKEFVGLLIDRKI